LLSYQRLLLEPKLCDSFAKLSKFSNALGSQFPHYPQADKLRRTMFDATVDGSK